MKKYKKYRLKKHIKRKVIEILLIISVIVMSIIMIKIGLDNYNKLAIECDAYYKQTCTHYDINNYTKTR